MKLVFSLFLSHIRIFKERSDKSQKSTFEANAHFQVLIRNNVRPAEGLDRLLQRIKQFVWELISRLMSSIKEVIQPQVPLRLPCYDFTPVMNHTVVTVLPKVRLATSGATHSHGVTGGVYKARERIHRDILIRDY